METLVLIGLIYLSQFIVSIIKYSAKYNKFGKSEYWTFIPSILPRESDKTIEITWIGWSVKFKGI